MAAPTPASAYLHSATMVKAGIVLLLFLAPGFSGDPIWYVTVTAAGLITMLLGAWQALRQHDLKLLLAHGTVSQLGFIVTLIGLGLIEAALAVTVGHAAFKAALFLVVGIIDKQTGTRDLRELTGLARRFPVLAFAGGAAALSMAGIPPLLGFVTKEAAFDALIADDAWIALAGIATASILTVAYTARFWFGAFGGPATESAPTRTRVSLIGPPALLAIASIILGVAPGLLGSVVESALGEKLKLVLWPGFKPALAVSAVVISAGAVAYRYADRVIPGSRWRAGLTAQGLYAAALRGMNRTAEVVTGLLQNGSLPVYLAVIITTVLSVPLIMTVGRFDGDLSITGANSGAEVALAAVAVAAAVAAARAKRRMAAALLLGAVGYAVAGVYVTFGAPDLALTQLLVETFTVALFAFVLARLPRQFGEGPRSLTRRTRLAVATLAGVFVTLVALVTTAATPERSMAEFYTDNAVEAGGRNVVNVILTDFRALDTLGEITVLAAAAIGVGALVGSMRKRRAAEMEG